MVMHSIDHIISINRSFLFLSGYRSIELKPLAAVSVELGCNSRELQVTGPIQITLPLPDNSGLRVSDPVPAWAFDSKTGKKKEKKKK